MIRKPLLLLCFLLLPGSGCTPTTTASSSGDASALRSLLPLESLFVAPPTIRPNPIERVPLVAIIEFESPVEVVPTLEISDGQRTWEQPWRVPPARKHRLAALGLRPDREHQIRVKVATADQQSDVSPPLSFRTPPLPASFPPLHTIVSQPEKMEPGVTLFAVNLWRNSISILDYGYIIALDEAGEVVWFCNAKDRIADMQILRNGNILYQHGNYRYAYEIDVLGRDVRRWYGSELTEAPDEQAIAVKVDTLHHDLLEKPDGNFMTLATELLKFDEFPTSEFNPEAPWEPAHVVCDAVVEFEPASGKIIDRLPLVGLLDRKRFGYMALSGFWKDKYNERIGGYSRDWSHANALVYLPQEQAIIVSFRHLDCIMKIDWKSKQIRWIFGDPEGWGPAWQKYLLKPQGDLEWTYHQHSPQITPRGTLLMYDNGNYRARPFHAAIKAEDNYSRVVEFEIDEQAMTVRQIFDYRGTAEDRFYCPFYCEADWLPQTQNILVTDGGHIELADGTPADTVPAARQWARIFEIRRTALPEKVYEIRCDSGLNS
ncbi:MAG: aryl-sulfate sulfotransferase, partial [Planctomycetales bacterium]|nr:aryl-sulfate sulfotransferase [Planctomycetales bacterium]